jgi:phosphate-selective porin OprO/OprP
MRPVFPRPYRLLAVGWLLCPLFAGVGSLPAQDVSPPAQSAPAAQPSVAALERRVAELEAVIGRMQAERQTPAARPVAVLQGVTPDGSGSEEPRAEPQPGPGRTDTSTDGGGGSGGGTGGSGSASGGSSSSGSRGLTAGWINDQFILQSADKKFLLRITGQIQVGERNFLERADAVDVDTFQLRRARFGLEADMFKYYEFRFLPDFGTGYLGTSPVRVQDGYMNVHYWDAFQFEIGKFKQPFSYEQLIQDRYIPTIERSMFDQLVPQRDLGIMVHGYHLLGNRLDYQLALSNGEINASPEIDTNEHKDVNARVAARPLHGVGPLVDWLQVGVSGSWGVEQEPIMPSPLRTPQTIPWLTFNPGVQEYGVRWRLSPEVSYFYRGLGLTAQYYKEQEQVRPVLTGPGVHDRVDLSFDGWYVMASYLLTGEERTTYSTSVKPLRPFNPCHVFACPGAWELIGRVSELSVGGQVFAPLPTGGTSFVQLANPALNSREATSMTLGFNWYLNAWVRLQCDYEHDWFGQPVQLGGSTANLTRDGDALTTRFEIIF